MTLTEYFDPTNQKHIEAVKYYNSNKCKWDKEFIKELEENKIEIDDFYFIGIKNKLAEYWLAYFEDIKKIL